MASKKKAQKRLARSKAQKKLANIKKNISPTGPVIKARYADPAGLMQVGPLVVAQWSLPMSLQLALTNRGRPVPPPVSGHMLVDTGATKTCIAEEVAQALNLKPVNKMTGTGAGGRHVNNGYFAHLTIVIVDPSGKRTVIENEEMIQGIPELSSHSKKLGILHGGKPVIFVGLLGRDFLRHAKFIYDGAKGLFSLEVNTKMMKAPAPLLPSSLDLESSFLPTMPTASS